MTLLHCCPLDCFADFFACVVVICDIFLDLESANSIVESYMQVRKKIEQIKYEQSFPEDLYLVLLGLVKQVLPKNKQTAILNSVLLVSQHTALL